jgi:hypothetical protein
MCSTMQPIYIDPDGVVRFKPNAIVAFLVDWARKRGMGLNDLAQFDFGDGDWAQFAQLIGYSVAGWSDLSYVSDVAREEANTAAELALNRPT